MNAWPFIIAAYAFSLSAIVLLVGLSWTAMRRAEAEAAKLSRDREA
jgi:hypothetical protein